MNSLSKDSKHKNLSYLYMIEIDFSEVNKFINELKNYKPFVLDVRESTMVQNALNISVVISYARNFKPSHGFENYKEINKELISNYTVEELKLHQKIIDARDQEFAHSDASVNDIQIYSEGHSRRTIRHLLEKQELEMLQQMVSKIREEIKNQIQYFK